MSAIAGICYTDGRLVDQRQLQRVVETLAHRGPDAHGVWNDLNAGLVNRMLWTTPESVNEHLPFVDPTGESTGGEQDPSTRGPIPGSSVETPHAT